jgi:hypothetical protein
MDDHHFSYITKLKKKENPCMIKLKLSMGMYVCMYVCRIKIGLSNGHACMYVELR